MAPKPVAIEAGATAVIQPGGSIRDDEVIKAADDAGSPWCSPASGISGIEVSYPALTGASSPAKARALRRMTMECAEARAA
jgi:hypothetical protein